MTISITLQTVHDIQGTLYNKIMSAVVSGITVRGGGRVPPEVFYKAIFADREKRGKDKGANESFFFFFFFTSLFETLEICLGSTKRKIFYQEKAFHASEKKSGKVTLPPLKNIPLTTLAMVQIFHEVEHEKSSRVESNISPFTK